MSKAEMVVGGTVYTLGCADGSPATDEVMERVRQIAEQNQSALERLMASPVTRQLLVDVGADVEPVDTLKEGLPIIRSDVAKS